MNFTVRDYARVKHLAAFPEGLPVRNRFAPDFVGYEHAGLVVLSPCYRGDGGEVVDPEFFWAKPSATAREALIFLEAIRQPQAEETRRRWDQMVSRAFFRGTR